MVRHQVCWTHSKQQLCCFYPYVHFTGDLRLRVEPKVREACTSDCRIKTHTHKWSISTARPIYGGPPSSLAMWNACICVCGPNVLACSGWRWKTKPVCELPLFALDRRAMKLTVPLHKLGRQGCLSGKLHDASGGVDLQSFFASLPSSLTLKSHQSAHVTEATSGDEVTCRH